MKLKALAIVSILFLGSSIALFREVDVEGGGKGIFSGYEPYGIGPLSDISVANEDQLYSSRYFAVMGEMNLNSFTTDADWLTASTSVPLVLNSTGLVGRWTFDRGSVSDSSGEGNHGTNDGATSVSGVFDSGEAMSFDGDDHISIPHSESLNITDEITVEAWIYPTFSDSGEHMIVSKGSNWDFDETQDYELTMDKDRPLFQMKPAGTDFWYGAAPMETIEKNMWHHLAGVYDGNLFYIYIDGINQTTLYNGWDDNYQGNTYSGGLPASEHNISIGRREPANWGSLYFEGSIDDVRIFNRSLSAEEVLEHATKPGENTLTISGTPDNEDVGEYDVSINITDNNGRYAERDFTLNVVNTAPSIVTEDVLEIYQDELYSVDYHADDEGQGDTSWELVTEASWLTIDPDTGLLEGTPGNDDVGAHDVTVRFHDGNGGQDGTSFTIDVLNVNDPPVIITENDLFARQGNLYEVQYQAQDPDDESFSWSLDTEASWLQIEEVTGILTGIPSNDDVGNHSVTVIVQDPHGLTAETDFYIVVSNVNDPPVWGSVPVNTTIDEGDMFVFDVDATDVDVGDDIEYEVSSSPPSDIAIDPATGELEWKATRDVFGSSIQVLKVTVSAFDGNDTISYVFFINMTPNGSPSAVLDMPANMSTISSNTTVLTWSASDPEEDQLTYLVYLSSRMSRVRLQDDEVLIADLSSTSFEISDLEPGTTYYWTVIPSDGYSNGTCVSDMFSFYVNTPPTSGLLSPEDSTKVPLSGTVLEWRGQDADVDEISYDVYLSSSEDLLSGIPHSSGITVHELSLEGLEAGSTYYWTVIPTDGYSTGDCTDGVRSFTVNEPPSGEDVGAQEVTVGEIMEIDMLFTDEDELEYSLLTGPGGMSIDSSTGKLTWAPASEYVGKHTVIVEAYDGYDRSNLSFDVDVKEAVAQEDEEEKEEKGTAVGTILIIAIPVILVLIILAAAVFFVFKKKKGEEAEGPQDTKVPEENQEMKGTEEKQDMRPADTLETGEAYEVQQGEIGQVEMPLPSYQQESTERPSQSTPQPVPQTPVQQPAVPEQPPQPPAPAKQETSDQNGQLPVQNSDQQKQDLNPQEAVDTTTETQVSPEGRTESPENTTENPLRFDQDQ